MGTQTKSRSGEKKKLLLNENLKKRELRNIIKISILVGPLMKLTTGKAFRISTRKREIS